MSLLGGQARYSPVQKPSEPTHRPVVVWWPSLLGFLSAGVTPRYVTPEDLCEFCSLLLPFSSGVLA